MKSKKKLICTGFVFVLFMAYMLLDSMRKLEGEPSAGRNELAAVDGWGYNTTRETSHYIMGPNSSAHILPQHFCDQDSLLLVMVCSAPAHIEARNAIRDTWGKPRVSLGNNVSLYFLLGETANTTLQKSISEESGRFSDIIQAGFMDSYNNLTLKSIVMLKLVTGHCASTVKYLLKIDDDMFVNMDLIVKMLVDRNSSSGLLMGKLICGAKPIKDVSSKWYSSRYMYPDEVYPHYVSGTGYLMSVDVASTLYHTSLKTPIFHLEDVYITGICAKKSHIKPENHDRFTYQKRSNNPCLLQSLFTAHRFNPTDIRRAYAKMSDLHLTEQCNLASANFSVNRWIYRNVVKVKKSNRKHRCA